MEEHLLSFNLVQVSSRHSILLLHSSIDLSFNLVSLRVALSVLVALALVVMCVYVLCVLAFASGLVACYRHLNRSLVASGASLHLACRQAGKQASSQAPTNASIVDKDTNQSLRFS